MRYLRTGKVKSQTPIVGKQDDKPKKPKGRANMRKKCSKRNRSNKPPNTQYDGTLANSEVGGKRNPGRVYVNIKCEWRSEMFQYNGKFDYRGRIPDPWMTITDNSHIQDLRKNRFDVRKDQINKKCEKIDFLDWNVEPTPFRHMRHRVKGNRRNSC
eukprot:TRINITY_DN3201_c0_g1_i1.p1 TRINITY_DN3201_c0_g1~~TRINITY_DN3201_c0_g1_i1.p1  ORF type:complete len:156 (-),score=21.59 TRINITY_DN3201_c0_g1_i1:75-542(-)